MQATGVPQITPPARPVEYARVRPAWRRRTAQLQAALITTLVILGVGGWLWGPELWSSMALLNAQRRCLNAEAPATRVVYDVEPKRSAALLSLPRTSDGHYVSLGNGRPVAWVSTEFDAFFSTINSRARQPAPTLFLGERLTAAGTKRLVYVDASSTDNLYDPSRPCMVYLRSIVIVPGTFRSAPRERFPSQHNTVALTVTMDPTYPFRFFAGQPDPENASHFTIPFERDGRRAFIDGWLRDDESVKLELRVNRSPLRF